MTSLSFRWVPPPTTYSEVKIPHDIGTWEQSTIYSDASGEYVGHIERKGVG